MGAGAYAAVKTDRPVFNVRDYGAAADGRTKDTRAIKDAIEACGRAGGGMVYFPPGSYLTGAIQLKSNLTLYVEAGATILGSPDAEDYPVMPNPWPGQDSEIADPKIVFAALLYGERLSNVTISGRGVIDGQGQVWWDRALRRDPLVKLHGRPRLIRLIRSKNLLIEGLTLQNSPFWTVDPIFSEGITITGLTILNPWNAPNADGINLEACRNVHISNCHIDTGDDCVAIKSGMGEPGRVVGLACENITVTNCTMRRGHGGVVVGSDMSGGARNIAISNCVFQGTDKGIRLKSMRGRGGVVEGIVVNNIVMQDVPQAFAIDMYYRGGFDDPPEPVSEKTPVFRDILFSNISARGSKRAGLISGLQEMPLAGITFQNIRISAQEGFSCSRAKNLAFRDVEVDTERGPALIGRDIGGLEIAGFRSRRPHPDTAIIDLKDVRDVFLRGCWAAPETFAFLKVRGASSGNIVLNGNDLKYAKDAVLLDPDVPRGALR
jgi:polygalacturonase